MGKSCMGETFVKIWTLSRLKKCHRRGLCTYVLNTSNMVVGFDEFSIHTSSDFCSGEKVSLANVGVEPTTFALLARRSNQLS